MVIVMMNPLGSTAIGRRIVTKRHALGGAARTAPAGTIVGDNDARIGREISNYKGSDMRVLAAIAVVLALSAVPAFAGDLEDGLKFYQNKDYAGAANSWKKAAAQGNASAQAALGVLYEKGQGVPQDNVQAVFWYRKAADQGNAPAQTNLGFMYEKGQGVRQDNEQAVSWYRKAAERGTAEAQFNLGRMYQTGQGIAQDHKLAASWFEKAGAQGHTWAQSALGLMSETGQGVAQDYKQAVFWYQKAAESGDPLAQFDLGRIYETGQEGVAVDYVEAHKWWSIAASNGEERARKNRNMVERLMKPEQIAEAKRRADEWMKAHAKR
jgi:hypothetical protein